MERESKPIVQIGLSGIRARSPHLQIRIRHHQPLAARLLEVDLHPRMRAVTFEVGDHAAAELGVADLGAELEAGGGGFGGEAGAGSRR